MQYLLRRKIAPIIFIVLICPIACFSQLGENLYLEDHDDKEGFRYGIHLGLNRSHYNFLQHPRFLQFDSVMVIESINSTGLNFGMLINKRLGNHWDFRTFLSLVFTEKAFEYNLKYPDIPGGEEKLTVKKVQSITFPFPVSLKFSSDRIGNFKVFMMGGFKAEYDFAAGKSKGDIINLKKSDFGIEGGIGFHIYREFFVLTPEVKFGWGLTNVHDRNKDIKFSNTIDVINSRTLTFSLTIE